MVKNLISIFVSMGQIAGQKKIVFRGKVASGRGEGQYFTQLSWVCKQFSIKFGFEPVAGTFNLKLSPEDEALLETLKGFWW
jgi:riboflavin kinase